MKAITIKQPWATLIALGEKKFETRSWATKHRGPLAIHAGKSVDKEAFEDSWIKGTLAQHGIKGWHELPTGVVLATVDLVKCHKVGATVGHVSVFQCGEGISGLEETFGDYTPGRYAWELENLHVLTEPVLAKGQLSLWNWDEGENVIVY